MKAGSPRIAVMPKCYIHDIAIRKTMSLFTWIEMSVDLEAEGLEMYSLFLESLEPVYLGRVKAEVAKRGMVIPMLCCSPDLAHPDAAVRRKEILRQKEYMAGAARLGCETCRVLSGQRHAAVAMEDGLAWVISGISELLPLARNLGIKLALENHYKDSTWQYPEFAQKREVFLKILAAIDDPYLGVQFDPSNATMAGEDPLELLELVKARVISMHASDRYLLPGHTLEELTKADGTTGYASVLVHGETGKGLNDYERIFSILAARDYQGWISVEDGEHGMDEMKRSIQFLKKMRRKHFGDRDAVPACPGQ